MLNGAMLSVVMLSIIMLNVVIPSAIRLIVVAPLLGRDLRRRKSTDNNLVKPFFVVTEVTLRENKLQNFYNLV
jgi:hypothetical protein